MSYYPNNPAYAADPKDIQLQVQERKEMMKILDPNGLLTVAFVELFCIITLMDS